MYWLMREANIVKKVCDFQSPAGMSLTNEFFNYSRGRESR